MVELAGYLKSYQEYLWNVEQYQYPFFLYNFYLLKYF